MKEEGALDREDELEATFPVKELTFCNDCTELFCFAFAIFASSIRQIQFPQGLGGLCSV